MQCPQRPQAGAAGAGAGHALSESRHHRAEWERVPPKVNFWGVALAMSGSVLLNLVSLPTPGSAEALLADA